MKICPQCQNTYTDDSLQFCLQDGTPLNFQTPNPDWSESETVVLPKNRQNYTTQNFPTQDLQPPVINSTIQTPQQKSNKSKIVILVSLALLLFLGIVGSGTWILISNMRKEVSQVNANKSLNNVQNQNNSKQTVNTANNNSSKNTNNLSNANISPTPTPTPKPTLKPEDAAEVKEKIADTIDGWKGALESNDINGHLHYYGDTVDYYNAGKVSLTKVRADKQRAFDMYNSISIDISNVKTTIDDSGEKIVSEFDKEWNFANDEKTNSGKVRQQLQFIKLGGEWRIISEKDLKVYYVNK